MTQKKHFWKNNRDAYDHSRQAAVRAGYYRTRPESTHKRRIVDSVASPTNSSNVLLPASREEYLDALANRTPARTIRNHGPGKINQLFSREEWQKISKGRLSPGRIKTALPALIVVGILIVSVISLTSWRSSRIAGAGEGGHETFVNDGDTPSETPPYNSDNYHTAPDLPNTIRVRKIGLNSRVVRTSVRSNSEPKFPTNIYDVGWYENSAKPGEQGAALVIGHVAGHSKNGAFHDLTSLVPGDEIELETGDGRTHYYYVAKMVTYDRNQVDMSVLSQSAVEDKPGLNLLTAVASYEKNAGVTQQLVIFAVQDGIQETGENNQLEAGD